MPDVVFPNAVRAIGAIAAAALHESNGILTPLEEFPQAPYKRAGREIVWIGNDGPMHPRAIFLNAPSGWHIRLHDAPAPWRALRPRLTRAEGQAFRALTRRLLPELARSVTLSGFGPLLAGQVPLFPLAARAEACFEASKAALADDVTAFVAAAGRLLGVGLGLTPSGDDFVGAALFTLRALHPGDARWADAATHLACLAQSRTHSIGAALFTDLAEGQSFEPLHGLFAASDFATFADRANAIAAIGHSSGRDMLAGLVAASIGLPSPLIRTNAQDAP